MLSPPPARLRWLLITGISAVVVATNIVGAAIVLALLLLIIPLPPELQGAYPWWFWVTVASAYGAIAIVVGVVRGVGTQTRSTLWLTDDRDPTDLEQGAVLRMPMRIFQLQVSLWLVAAVIFGIIAARLDPLGGFWVALTIVLSGLTSGANTYLAAELMLRPVATRALSGGFSGQHRLRGVAMRAVFAWGLGTGVPVVGLVAIGLVALSGGQDASRRDLAVAMVALGSVALTFGFATVVSAARATADPVKGVAKALRAVQQGEFDTRTPVYDGTEIGRLQLGFNAMVEGLAERERIRDAFGAYVDPSVAAYALEEGIDAEGEEVEVTVMFVDVRGFTTYANQTDPREVVSTMNALFEAAVPIIRAHDGHVDKFTGDGLLAVFGAPGRLAQHADKALAAACELVNAMANGPDEAGDLTIGVGLNTGSVIAGNVGGAGRYEFSVMGDVVNIAARVEAATRETGDSLLITSSTRAALTTAPHFHEHPGVQLKGVPKPVTLFAPAT